MNKSCDRQPHEWDCRKLCRAPCLIHHWWARPDGFLEAGGECLFLEAPDLKCGIVRPVCGCPCVVMSAERNPGFAGEPIPRSMTPGFDA